jgi:sugar lactone lactonase YvrE
MRSVLAVLAAALLVPVVGCAGSGKSGPGKVRLEVVAESPRQWTGVAVARNGRMFVCFPRWSEDVPVSVAEIRDGTLRPFPDESWNSWKPGDDPQRKFVCAQSLVVDGRGDLWVLDPASPRFEGIVAGGPKLVRIDLSRNEAVEVMWFPEPIAPAGSYLNDVRVDAARRVAYITDSGLGALLTVDLDGWVARRILDGDRALRSKGIDVLLDGKPWRRPDGSRPDVHVDGIALSPDGQWLYLHALTALNLRRVPTAALLDVTIAPADLSAKIERVIRTGPVDGMEFGPDGSLYLAGIETSSVIRLTPEGVLQTVIADRRLVWPDSLAVGPDGSMYVTTSQIHRGPHPTEPYRIFRFRPSAR